MTRALGIFLFEQFQLLDAAGPISAFEIAGAMADSKIGLRGGQRVRVGETVREKIIAPELGYFIQDAV